MAEWDATSLLALARAFQESRLLLTGAELGLFDLLARETLSAAEVTQRLQGDMRAVTIVLDALTAMALLVKRDGRYACEPPVANLLASGTPGSVLPMVLHAADIFTAWSGLTAKTAHPAASAVASSEDRLKAFIGAMHVVSANTAAGLVAAAPPGGARRLLDIGGGSGSFTIAYLQAAPELRATLFDRPMVVELARERCADAGLLDRVSLAEGDFYTDPLPGGHDLALLSAIIHQNSPDENVALYRKVYAALEPGGRLVIRDHVLSPDRTAPRGGALFAVNMLCVTPGGNSYTFDEIRETLEAAGFGDVRLVQADERMTGVVVAGR